jgi:hypothetical protein
VSDSESRRCQGGELLESKQRKKKRGKAKKEDENEDVPEHSDLLDALQRRRNERQQRRRIQHPRNTHQPNRFSVILVPRFLLLFKRAFLRSCLAIEMNSPPEQLTRPARFCRSLFLLSRRKRAVCDARRDESSDGGRHTRGRVGDGVDLNGAEPVVEYGLLLRGGGIGRGRGGGGFGRCPELVGGYGGRRGESKVLRPDTWWG